MAETRAESNTIVALATPAGRGGVGVLRISGPAVPDLAPAVIGRLPEPRRAAYVSMRDRQGATLDRGLAIYFPAPHSFTGEHVLELHAHGGPVVLDCLIREILHLGARLARPGEFSERAFLNDKIDLTQAEAIADLIDSASEQAARSAVASMEGAFSRRVNAIADELIEVRMLVEASIDFPDEDETGHLDMAPIQLRLDRLEQDLAALIGEAEQGRRLQEGMRVVLAGQPNAGKSSLLNALVGRDAAIVTPHAGTTRDVLRETILLDGVPVQLIDTAGLRESEDEVESEGIRRAWLQIEAADLVLLLLDAAEPEALAEAQRAFAGRAQVPMLVARNKADLLAAGAAPLHWQQQPVLDISATTGSGLDRLLDGLRERLGLRVAEEAGFIARRRHLVALEQARSAVLAASALTAGTDRMELLAEELRLAHQALGEIVGRFTTEDLLTEIFSHFCLGK